MDSPNVKNSRRKTLDLSRLSTSSFASPSKGKRYSWDPGQSPLRSSNAAEKLAFIEESLKALKAETNPLAHTPGKGFRSLTAPPGANVNTPGSRHTKWFHKNDTAELRTKSSVDESSMPPRYQRRHKGMLDAWSSQKDRKSRQPGCSTIFFTIVAVVGVLGANYWFIKDFQKGVCARNLTLNMTNLNATLRHQVFGQHLAVDIVPSLVYEHMVPLETKPLVMAFLGWTGVGKNYVSSILGDHIRTKKRTVHEYIIPLHFPHDDGSHSYTQLVQDWVIGNLSSCTINLVIIDEMEKASEDVLQGIEVMLERFEKVRLNSTRIIVLLLSSTGGTQINKYVYDHITDGGQRETICRVDIQKILENTEAQWYLSMNSRGLIDSIVPFLPLEKEHVARCIEQDIETKHDTCANPHIVAKVMQELTFFPSNNPMFSAAGCRKVGTKVDLVIDSIESRHSYYAPNNHEEL